MENSDKLEIGVAGAGGRMGRALLHEIAEGERFLLVAATARPGNGAVGTEQIGGIIVDNDPAAMFGRARVVLDFTAPNAVAGHAKAAAEAGTALLIGTTGLDACGHAALVKAAKRAAILIAPNTSIGVNLLIAQVREAALRLGPGYAIEITDLHHKDKIDAPSGTALALANAAAAGRGEALDELRDQPGGISISSRREGEAAGEHRVSFVGPDERIEYFHRAEDRALFAKGALTAALWLADQPPGLYSMADMLGAGTEAGDQ